MKSDVTRSFQMSEERRILNAQVLNDPGFIKACEKANVKPTVRQASAYRRGFGAAYKSR